MIPRPLFGLGAIVFERETLEKATIFEQVFTRGGSEPETWRYRLSIGADEMGRIRVTEGLFTEDRLCIKAEAEEILKTKAEAVQE